MHAIKLNTELARPIGIVDGTRPGGANRKPRSHTVALTDCVVTYADGTTRTIARNTRSPHKAARATTTAPQGRVYTDRQTRDRDLMARMGTIHQEV